MKKIIFAPKSKTVEKIVDPPKPSIKCLPDWYKKLSPRVDEKNVFSRLPNNHINSTAKSCIPIFDSLSAGYILQLPCDVEFVDPEHYGYRVIWDVSWTVITEHSEKQIGFMELPQEYERSPLKWEGSWNIKTPRGYSLLYTHPFYRYDLPFISATGIVDSDVYDTAMNIPFFIKKNFYGIIPMGTPIAQIIPIKRENWSCQIKSFSNDDNDYRFDNIKLKMKKSYKNRFWQKKFYC